MALQPVARRSVPDEVFDQILDDVVSGEFAPGQPLPSERRLAEVLGVSRPAVREALQRVAQAGLVEVRQGDATTVRDYRRHASLDPAPPAAVAARRPRPSGGPQHRGGLLLIGPEVAALAATRAGRSLDTPLRETVAALEADPDPVARRRHALTFWDHVVDGADSIVFRLMFNSLRTAITANLSQIELYRKLADAIVTGAADTARHAAEHLLT